MNESLSVHESSTEALTMITTSRSATMLGMKSESISEKPMTNETIYGDGSKLSILTDEKGNSVGNLFSARQGKRSYYLVISGIYFDTPTDWDDFAGANIRKWLEGKSD